jgi:hypothetical protein
LRGKGTKSPWRSNPAALPLFPFFQKGVRRFWRGVFAVSFAFPLRKKQRCNGLFIKCQFQFFKFLEFSGNPFNLYIIQSFNRRGKITSLAVLIQNQDNSPAAFAAAVFIAVSVV